MTILTPTNNSAGNTAGTGLPDEAALSRMAAEFFSLVPAAAQAAAQFLPSAGLSHLQHGEVAQQVAQPRQGGYTVANPQVTPTGGSVPFQGLASGRRSDSAFVLFSCR